MLSLFLDGQWRLLQAALYILLKWRLIPHAPAFHPCEGPRHPCTCPPHPQQLRSPGSSVWAPLCARVRTRVYVYVLCVHCVAHISMCACTYECAAYRVCVHACMCACTSFCAWSLLCADVGTQWVRLPGAPLRAALACGSLLGADWFPPPQHVCLLRVTES